jgi:ribonucleotide reductase alpha subunit
MKSSGAIGPRNPISQQLHEAKYRQRGESFDDYCVRYARTTADDARHFRDLLYGLRTQAILPAGRQQRAVGWPFQTTAFNCFVGGTIHDSMSGIMDELKNSMMTLRSGGGDGWDFSPLRPHGWPVYGLGDDAYASGPVSFMPLWHSGCSTIRSAGERRGAMMGVLNVHHPDIMSFVRCKANGTSLTNFNISVGVTDEFMEAVQNDGLYELRFPVRPTAECPTPKVVRTVRALDVWAAIMENNWDWAEPGVLFLDTINRMNPLSYCEYICATNPCVIGDTLILTSEGWRRIAECVSKSVEIWNGEQWSRVTPRVTGTREQVVHVCTEDGRHITCTRHHEFYLRNGQKVEAKDLRGGVELETYSLPEELAEVQRPVVSQVTDAGIADVVYCFTEPMRHRGVFNGILTSNCGEQPLPPDGACLLLSHNLVKYLVPSYSWTGEGRDLRLIPTRYEVDLDRLAYDVSVSVRACDNVFESTVFPLEAQRKEALAKRRMGAGVTGVANALEVCGYRYGTAEYIEQQDRVLEVLRDTAYLTSIEMAKVKGSFPLFDAPSWLASGFAQTLPEHIRDGIKRHGLRNGLLLSIAPNGTISLVADNVSSGIEAPPVIEQERTINYVSGQRTVQLNDWAYEEHGIRCRTSLDTSPREHIAVLCAAQRFIDSAISKTTNVRGAKGSVPADGEITFDEYKDLYLDAYKGDAKGCTTFNVNGKRAGIITERAPTQESCLINPATGEKVCG